LILVGFKECIGKHVLVSVKSQLPNVFDVFVVETTKNKKFVKLRIGQNGESSVYWFRNDERAPRIVEVLN